MCAVDDMFRPFTNVFRWKCCYLAHLGINWYCFFSAKFNQIISYKKR